MNISSEFLWFIYGLTFLFLAILAAAAARRNNSMNVAAGVAFAAFLALVLVYVIILLNPQSYDTPSEKESISYLLWTGGIIFVFALLFALAMAMRNRHHNINELEVEVACDDNGRCEVVGLKQLRANEKGVHYMSLEKENMMVSPVGHMKIEPLV